MTDLHSCFFASLLIFHLSISKCDTLVQYFEGDNATLACKYNSKYHGKCHICWTKGDIPNRGCGDEIIGSDGDKVVRRKSDRYQMTGDIEHGDVSLTIINIQKKDSGKYGCRIHVPGWFNDEKNYVNLVVKDAPVPTTQEPVAVTTIPGQITTETHSTYLTRDTTQESTSVSSASGFPESTTTGLWPFNTTYDNYIDESSSMDKKESVNTTAIIVPVLLLLLALVGIALILLWKQKSKRRDIAQMAQNSDSSVIYNNSGSTVGLYNREIAVDNVYQIESTYEQWH
ncbi:hepatitis A virus cellular receptor 1 isoform X2 [Paramisgurnus dabryanus]|uniref:hepatitis A virus cellular receptor 1 isoform X2 n=1 Tax=Paramisgurnus dabryanus TaxID=90735 RepID=UPI0031F44864